MSFYKFYINAITINGSNAGSFIKCSRVLTQWINLININRKNNFFKKIWKIVAKPFDEIHFFFFFCITQKTITVNKILFKYLN